MNRILTPINIGAFELANRRVHSADGPDAAATFALPGSLHFAPLLAVVSDERGAPARRAAWDAAPLGGMAAAIHDRGGIAVARLARPGRSARSRRAGEGVPDGGTFVDEASFTPAALDEWLAAFQAAARRTVDAGFEGIEIDGTDLCLDAAGVEAGSQLLVEIVEAVAAECPRERLGVRLSPFGSIGNGAADLVAVHVALLGGFNDLEIAFVHLRLPPRTRTSTTFFPGDSDGLFRSAFRNPLVLSGGLDAKSAEEALARRFADAVGFDDGPDRA